MKIKITKTKNLIYKKIRFKNYIDVEKITLLEILHARPTNHFSIPWKY